jgi:acetyl esterase/lipase
MARLFFCLLILCTASLAAQNSATIDAQGTAHINRIIPMPTTLSPEARKWTQDTTERDQKASGNQSLEERRRATDAWRKFGTTDALRHYPAEVKPQTIAGVRCDIVTPVGSAEGKQHRVLINLHGGGFVTDSGSLIEGIPIANLAQTKVVSVYYRLAPENAFPAAVDDVVAVYRELLKSYKPQEIGIFGTSAGATLAAEASVRIKQLGLPLPAALGIFSVHPDYSQHGDSQAWFTLNGLAGSLDIPTPDHLPDESYVGKTDRRDPVLSPVFADLHGFPPTLLVTSTRDILLSHTSLFHRALLRQGVDAQLVVYEALPHAFWYHFGLPETKEALQFMADFFDHHVGAGAAAK